MTSNVDVIDISHHQAAVDFHAVKAAGVVGVILKATEGAGVVDKTYAGRRVAAAAAGLQIASYHFLRPGDMAKQMKFFLKVVDPVDGERVVLDHEDENVPLTDLVTATMILLEDKRGLQVTIYSGHLIKQQLGNRHNDILADTSLWLAQYGTTPTWPKGTWDTWTLWQYSDQGAVPGVGGGCDVNHFNGSADSCKRWMTPAAEVKPGTSPDPGPVLPPPATAGDTMLIDITTTATVTVSVRINGVVVTQP